MWMANLSTGSWRSAYQNTSKIGHPAERSNLEFLIGLRNKIEHRQLPELDPALYGECQAALINFDDFITSEFGIRHALSESLAVSLQFSRSIPPQKATALSWDRWCRFASNLRRGADYDAK